MKQLQRFSMPSWLRARIMVTVTIEEKAVWNTCLKQQNCWSKSKIVQHVSACFITSEMIQRTIQINNTIYKMEHTHTHKKKSAYILIRLCQSHRAKQSWNRGFHVEDDRLRMVTSFCGSILADCFVLTPHNNQLRHCQRNTHSSHVSWPTSSSPPFLIPSFDSPLLVFLVLIPWNLISDTPGLLPGSLCVRKQEVF